MTTSPAMQRFTALDVLRGMTVCFMIIVNSPGSGAGAFSPLQHARWHGFTPTDLVFPSFLFVVGNAMSFTMPKYKQMGNAAVLAKIFKRTAIIFLLGYLMYWFPFFREAKTGGYEFSPISDTRILGVLQRIALCYCIASLLIHYLSKKAVWSVSVVFLLGYWLIMYLGGDYTLTGNAGIKLDKLILGESHMYHGEGIAFDPEGLLSTIPAIVNVIIGYYAGLFIREKGQGFETIARLMIAGAALLCIGYFWDLLFPINKKLWTSSFVLYTCGLDLMLLGVLIYIIDIVNKKKWTRFFEVFGKNPLFIYLLSEILVIILFTVKTGPETSLYESINNVVYQKLAPGPWGSLLFALSVMFFCWVAGWWMDKRKVYVRV
jgi:predicted acyltransferase